MSTRHSIRIGLVVLTLALGLSIYTNPAVPALATETLQSVRVVIPAGAATTDVQIVDFAFSPAGILVPVGTTVHWHNFGTFTHTVTAVAPAGAFDSGDLTTGLDFSFLFTQSGVYSYHCIHHPSVMIGSVIVADMVGQTFMPFVAQ